MKANGPAVAIPDALTVRGRTLSGFSELSPPVARSLQRMILQAADDCGCTTGTIVVAAALAVYMTFNGVLPWLAVGQIRLTWTGGIFTFLSSAICGKVLGLALAARRLRKGIEQFETNRLRASEGE